MWEKLPCSFLLQNCEAKLPGFILKIKIDWRKKWTCYIGIWWLISDDICTCTGPAKSRGNFCMGYKNWGNLGQFCCLPLMRSHSNPLRWLDCFVFPPGKNRHLSWVLSLRLWSSKKAGHFRTIPPSSNQIILFCSQKSREKSRLNEKYSYVSHAITPHISCGLSG